MRVAVIGGTGFVGEHVLRALAAAGHDPLAIARRVSPGFGFPFRPADATVDGSLDGPLTGCDAVVWAAGSLRQSRRQTFHDIHTTGVRHLVAACRSRHVRRMVLVSALGAREGSRSAFYRAKWSGEVAARHSLLDVTVLRPSAIYGEGDNFVAPMSRMLRRWPVAPLPGAGTSVLAPVAVEDVARAAIGSLARPETAGAALDLPGPEVISIGDVYERVMEAIGVRRPRVGVPYVVIEPLSYLVRRTPGVPFSFDQLAILEEEATAAKEDGWRALELSPQRFTGEAIRAAVA